MSITYPKKSSITGKHRTLIVSLGGSSASLDKNGDKISTFAKDFGTVWNRAHPSAKIAAVYGGATPFNSSRRITEKIADVCEKMLSVSGKMPKLVLVGKSMGGCKLHKVVNRLDEEEIDIDLFIGVDMSCFVARHYDAYVKHKKDAKVFPSHVKSLVNFFQTKKGERQSGHVALWEGAPSCKVFGPQKMCRDYNINVNEDCVRIDQRGRISFGGEEKLIEKTVGHMDIDSDPRLLAALGELVEKRVLNSTVS